MARKQTVDKWKTKKWFDIVAPKLFNEKIIGETIADAPKKLSGRVVEVSLSDIAGEGSHKLQRIKLRFKITDVSGTRCVTEFLGHRIAQDFERSLTRKRTSKVYVNKDVETKDKNKLRVKTVLVTSRVVNSSRLSAIREKYEDFLEEQAKKQNMDEFINDALYGRFGSKSKKAVSSVYPLKYAIIQKTELIPQEPVAA